MTCRRLEKIETLNAFSEIIVTILWKAAYHLNSNLAHDCGTCVAIVKTSIMPWEIFFEFLQPRKEKKMYLTKYSLTFVIKLQCFKYRAMPR